MKTTSRLLGALLAGAIMSVAAFGQLPTEPAKEPAPEGFTLNGHLTGQPDDDGNAHVLILAKGTYFAEALVGDTRQRVPFYLTKNGLRTAFASGCEFTEPGQYKIHVLPNHRKGFRLIRRLDENGR